MWSSAISFTYLGCLEPVLRLCEAQSSKSSLFDFLDEATHLLRFTLSYKENKISGNTLEELLFLFSILCITAYRASDFIQLTVSFNWAMKKLHLLLSPTGSAALGTRSHTTSNNSRPAAHGMRTVWWALRIKPFNSYVRFEFCACEDFLWLLRLSEMGNSHFVMDKRPAIFLSIHKAPSSMDSRKHMFRYSLINSELR